MSSRLFQKIREELGLAYTVFSYVSLYKDNGIAEIYAGVSNDKRDLAMDAALCEIKRFADEGVTQKEYLKGETDCLFAICLAFFVSKNETTPLSVSHKGDARD